MCKIWNTCNVRRVGSIAMAWQRLGFVIYSLFYLFIFIINIIIIIYLFLIYYHFYFIFLFCYICV